MLHTARSHAETPIAPTDPLNAIVAHYPEALAVFQRFGLDTCCGGALPLDVAAEHHGLDIADVMTALRDAIGARPR